jgi:pentose-5-phosphate-3-epimerase
MIKQNPKIHLSYWRGIAGLLTLVLLMALTFIFAGQGFSNASSQGLAPLDKIKIKAGDTAEVSGEADVNP